MSSNASLLSFYSLEQLGLFKEIIQKYEEGATAKTLAENYQCSQRTVYKILKVNGISSEGRSHKHIYDWAQIIKEYEDGATCTELKEKYGFSFSSFSNKRKLHSVPLNPRTDIDARYFNNIDNEYKAYWLGFISADGSVSKNQVSIRLHLKDKEHLIKFKETIGSARPITEGINNFGSPWARLRICSTEMVVDLQKYGVIQNKSKNFIPLLQNVSENLLRHYWRGMIDGDGWISNSKSIHPHTQNTYSRTIIGLCGTYNAMTQFQSYCKNIISKEAKLVKRTESNFQIAISANKDVKQLLENLYEDSEISLDRKKDIAKGFLGQS